MTNHIFGRRGAALALAVSLTLGGCDSLLDVTLPGSTTASSLDDPSFAELMTLSAQGEFEKGFSDYVFTSGFMGGELIGGQLGLGPIVFQRRNVREDNGDYVNGVYIPMSTSRFMADDAIKRLTAFTDAQVPTRTRLLGRANLYAGFNYAVFGEGFCSAAFDLGPELKPTQMMELAKDRFTKAVTLGGQANDAETVNAGNVGLARALLWLGQNPAALEAARKVPAGFRKDVTRSNAATARRNTIFVPINKNRGQSIDPHYWNVRFGGVADPRVRVTNTGTKAVDGLTDLWFQTKYTSEASPIRLASYTEAQLIVAEIVGGQEAIDIINRLHTAAGIPAYSGAGQTAAQIKNQVISERQMEFFLEGRRFGDLIHYGGLEEWAMGGPAPYPAGKHPFDGNNYGPGNKCFPLPQLERLNNPNLGGKG
jgi:starch-binding outer membrane protein, SusD/RagB family